MKKRVAKIVIIGGGPAGINAGIYAKRAGFNIVILESFAIGGQMNLTENIDNYPGFPNKSGAEIINELNKHLNELDINVVSEKVIKIEKDNENYNVILENGENIFTNYIIIATGGNPKRLNLKNEEKFIGRGISFCATCDAPLYKNKDIIVVGSGNTALTESLVLAKESKSIKMLIRKDRFSSTGELKNAVLSNPKIQILYNTEIKVYIGDKKIKGVNLINNKTKEETKINTDGIFLFLGRLPNVEFLENKIDINKNSEIIVNENMETSMKNVYAAGDVRENSQKQIISAMADAVVIIKNIEKKENLN